MAIVQAELLCNPTKADHFLYLLKYMVKKGLWSCFDRDDFEDTSKDCLQKEYEQNSEDNFQEI
ncbi:unnamed protein product, partial [Allacma fusca]